jgi:hypothetical protein
MMKLKFFLLALLFVSLSCDDDDPVVINTETFLVEVDNIIVSEVTETTLPITLDFYGMVGTDGCHRFSYFEYEFDGNDIIIKCWGMRRVDPGIVCTDNIVELNGERLSLRIESAGQYFIRVIQSDGSEYEQELVVN